MSSQLLFLAIDVIGVFAVLLIGLRLMLTNPTQPTSQLLALVCLDSACARLLARHEYAVWIVPEMQLDVGALEPALNFARNLTPGLFMIVCHRLFQERALPRWLYGAFTFQLLLEDAIPAALGMNPDVQHSGFEIIPALIQLGLICHGLRAVLSGWRTDLVENRRRLRWTFLLIVGSHVLLVVLLERLLIPWQHELIFPVHVWLSAFGATLACVALFAMLKADTSAYTEPCRLAPPAVAPLPVSFDRDAADLARLEHALSDERLYRDPALGIHSLARQLKIPEYRVRKLIHERLGYRNFNALLHAYRLRDASASLIDPEQRHVPILTIALSSGYRSINPFNRAFRAAHRVTPSEFRHRALASAAPKS